MRAVVLVVAVFSDLALGLAHPGETYAAKASEVAGCSVLDGDVAAPTSQGVAHIVGALVAVVTGPIFAKALCAEARRAEAGKNAFVFADRSIVCRHTARTSISFANVVDAFVAVIFAHDACTKVAHAVNADAGNATERATRSVFDPGVNTMGSYTLTPLTAVVGAGIAVVAVHSFTGVVIQPVAARDERKQQENEDPKKSE